MTGFEQLGVNEPLIANTREAGFEEPSELQRSVIPVMRRGGNAVVTASPGSGITTAYALAVLERTRDASGISAVVVVPTSERADDVARRIALLARGLPVRVAAMSAGWPDAASADVIVASTETLLLAVQESRLKLDQIATLVVDGVSAILTLAGPETVERLFASLPKDGQRVLISSDMTDDVRKLAEAHARKAIHFPARPAVERAVEKPEPEKRLRYVVAETGRKADAVARIAGTRGGPIELLCRSARSAANAERELRDRGFDVHAARHDDFARGQGESIVIAYDVPFSASQLQGLANEDTIVCERDELMHLRQIAADANIGLEAAKAPPIESDSLTVFRNDIRRAARDEDLDAQMLVLEPLFREFSPAEVAAAASALLRAKRPSKAEPAASKPGIKTWSRLFLSVGERDGIRPGDLVGAITGEAGIRGDDVGKVEIRDTFSVVEVVSDAADRVIKSMNGTTMKNRSLRVDYDRKTTAGGRDRRPQDRRSPPRPHTRRER